MVEMKKSNTNLELPVISNKLKIIDWFKACDIFCDDYIVQSGALLSLMSRRVVAVPALAPALVTDKSFPLDWGLFAQELVHRLGHTGANYGAANKTMFSQLVTVTLGTLYASTIASFKRAKDWRGAPAALNAQFAGATHWDKEVKVYDAVGRDHVFNGCSGTRMHKFVAAHCAVYHGLQRCATNVTCTVPDGREHVNFLTDGMAECNDVGVKAALANIFLGDSPTGMRNVFEKAVAKGEKERANADVSADGAAIVGSTAGQGGRRGWGGG